MTPTGQLDQPGVDISLTSHEAEGDPSKVALDNK